MVPWCNCRWCGKPRQSLNAPPASRFSCRWEEFRKAILRSLQRVELSRYLGRVAFVRGLFPVAGCIFGVIGIWRRCFCRVLISRMHRGLSFGLLAWERDERRPPPQILSFLPPCLHSKSMTSGVSGGGGGTSQSAWNCAQTAHCLLFAVPAKAPQRRAAVV